MSDFYDRVLEDPQAALRTLDGKREEDFALLMGGINHPDEKVRARLIANMFHRVFEGTFRPYRDKTEQVLEAVRARYPDENTRVQLAIIEFFKMYALREGMKDREEFRPIQLHALRHSNPEVAMTALTWSIYFYNDEVGAILRDLMVTDYDRKVRGRAMVIEMSRQEAAPGANIDDFFEVLLTQDFPWQNLATKCVGYIRDPEHLPVLAELAESPRVDPTIRSAIRAHLNRVVPSSDLPVTEKQDIEYRMSDMKALSDLLGVTVTEPLSNEETWKIAVNQIVSGQISYYDVCSYIYGKLFNRTMLERIEKDVYSRPLGTIRERIDADHERIWSYINRMDTM